MQDLSQTIGAPQVARFGWKGAVTTLQQFAADAYLNEMGITTQSCFHGTSINTFSTENTPNLRPIPVGCDDLAPFPCRRPGLRGSVQVRLNRGVPGVTHPRVANSGVRVNAVSAECACRGR